MRAKSNTKPPRARKTTHSAANDAPKQMYSLRLYITGQTPRSAGSVQNLKQVCEQYLAGNFELEVIDIYQQPELAQEAQIIAAPTLIKRLPLPLRRLVGDLSNRRRVLLGLDLNEDPAEAPTETPARARHDDLNGNQKRELKQRSNGRAMDKRG
jgi:circadian clock protein KaiB